MLILTRKESEAITVDGPAEIRVLSVQGNRVRLGITADRETTVLREEVPPHESVASG